MQSTFKREVQMKQLETMGYGVFAGYGIGSEQALYFTILWMFVVFCGFRTYEILRDDSKGINND